MTCHDIISCHKRCVTIVTVQITEKLPILISLITYLIITLCPQLPTFKSLIYMSEFVAYILQIKHLLT